MPFLCRERPTGETLGIDRASIPWIITATAAGENTFNARSALAAVSPISVGGNLVRRDIELVGKNDPAQFPGIWEATVQYAPIERGGPVREAGNPDAIEWSGSIGGGTRKIKKAFAELQTQWRPGVPTPTPFALPDFKGSINVSAKGEVEGTDIPSSNCTFNMSMKVKFADFTMDYLNILAKLADNTVNDGFFLGFAPGELQFLGADFHQIDQSFFRFTYKFHASPNRTNYDIDEFHGLNIGGHDYVWFAFRDEEQDAKIVSPMPYAVVIDRVTTPADYTQLGFGP